MYEIEDIDTTYETRGFKYDYIQPSATTPRQSRSAEVEQVLSKFTAMAPAAENNCAPLIQLRISDGLTILRRVPYWFLAAGGWRSP